MGHRRAVLRRRGSAAVLTAACLPGASAEEGPVWHAKEAGWVLGSLGKSCREACLGRGQECNEKHWPKSLEQLEGIARELNYSCVQFQEGSMRYDPSASGPYCGWMGDLRNWPRGRCSARPPVSAQRFCLCGPEADVPEDPSAAARPVLPDALHDVIDDAKVMSAPYNCSAGYMNWQLSWSHNKATWCCTNRGHGCAGVTQAATSASTTVMTTTTFNLFNCTAGLSKWEDTWSETKKMWCCLHHGLGCTGAGIATTTPAFDCDDGFTRWEQSWSIVKRGWCCRHANRGCSGRHAKTFLPYDCDDGYANWLLGWSSGKKRWCCTHWERGCSLLPSLPAQSAMAATSRSSRASTFTATSTLTPATATSTATMATATEPFDCEVGLTNWASGWSDEKKLWCCSRRLLGCAIAATPDVLDCHAGLGNSDAGWSKLKKDWCCRHERLGCPATTTPWTFDCRAGLADWQLGWSDEKKRYCCRHFSLGCATAVADEGFDCQAGASNWVAVWSPAKKQWCCDHRQLGCTLEANQFWSKDLH